MIAIAPPHRRGLAVAALLALGLALGGCRATVVMTQEDLAGTGDLSYDGPDIGTVPDLKCAAVGPEICGNGCDDDRNGYTDDDDPACTTQLLVSFSIANPSQDRLLLEPTPHLKALDGNPVPANSFAALRASLGPDLYELQPGPTLRRVVLKDGGYTDQPLAYVFARALCVFRNELIVVERQPSSVLHRVMRDGVTEVGTVALGPVLATSCSSDGDKLYVAVHDVAAGPSRFLVYDQTFTPGTPIAIPAALAGVDRVLAFTWTKRQGLFYGLFTSAASPSDNLSAPQLYPFLMDGAAGGPVDAGVYYGVGEFVP